MKSIFHCIFFACFVLPIAFAQSGRIARCGRRFSENSPGAYDVHCSCMQKLLELNTPIHTLTVNQTGCSSLALNVDWKALQTYIGVTKVVIEGAVINIVETRNEMINCTVKEIIFDRSSFLSITTNAFNGLKSLEIIRFVNSDVGSIEFESFAGYDHLKTIEFASTNIMRIEESAFSDLPLIEDLAFVNCSIETLAKNAISIENAPKHPKPDKCPLARTDAGDSLTQIARLLDDVSLSGRSLEHVKDVTLPEFGSKLLFFACKIQIIESDSIDTNAFPYIIFGGNEIEVVESDAIKAEIKNDCDISSFLLIANHLSYIASEAFAGVTGDRKNSFYDTVFAVVDNVFKIIEPKGFLIDPRLSTHYVKGNSFPCACDRFSWLVSDEDSKVQLSLDWKLIDTGTCIEGKDVLSFLLKCEVDPIPEAMKNHSTTTKELPDAKEPSTDNPVTGQIDNKPLVGSGVKTLPEVTVLCIVLSVIFSKLI